LRKITCHNNATVGSGSVVNEILRQYNTFSQLFAEYQEHGGAVNTATSPKVQYAFASGAANYVRPTATIYPNGRQLNYDYGSAGSAADNLSRVASLIDSNGTLHLADSSGNWKIFKEDSNGDGTWDLDQLRSHNKFNEITGLTGGGWASCQHDRARNMTQFPKPGSPSTALVATRDAWNMMVRITSGGQTVAEYVHDGLKPGPIQAPPDADYRYRFSRMRR
jgi:hypothetical protein